jgi:glycosyltransferase involved in cell wall biosynthesis
MKVLHVLYSGLGGHANVFFSFVNADENNRYDYEALFAGNEKIREEYIDHCNRLGVPWTYAAKRKRFDISFNRLFISTIRKSDARIILIQGSRFILLAKLAALLSANKKKVVIVDTQANHLKTAPEWLWLSISLVLADRVVFLTEYFKEEIRKKFAWIYNPNRISIINNGLDIQRFKPASLPVEKREINIGMQSRIVPIKDHATLLKAFATLLPLRPELNLKLKIAGDGESLKELEQLVSELNIEKQVIFTGMLNEEKLIEFLQSLDIYVHASFGEVMSTAIMQAMACKLPVIASDVPGINNMIINEKTGILVPVENAPAMCDSLVYLLDNIAVANKIKVNAFSFAMKHYSNNFMFQKYAESFELIL